MSVLNPFVEHNEQRFSKFLNELCEVGDFYEALEMEQYVSLSKRELVLNITLNELYLTHEVLLTHIDTLTPEPDSHLRICLQDLGQAQSQLSRSDNRTISLQLVSRWDQTNIDTSSSNAADQLTRGEFLYYDAKALVVQILRLTSSNNQRVDIDEIIGKASKSRDPIIMRKAIKLGDMIVELVRLKQTSHPYTIMSEEIEQELQHLGNLQEKAHAEMKSLVVVYKTIQDHNDYLRSQLETYKAYLQNVRVQSSPIALKESKSVAPVRFSHQKLETEGVICDSNVPVNRRDNIYFQISTPFPGTFLISLHYKGRDAAILEMDLKLDDLLEKQQLGISSLDLEYVKFDVVKSLQLLNNTFFKR